MKKMFYENVLWIYTQVGLLLDCNRGNTVDPCLLVHNKFYEMDFKIGTYKKYI